MLCSCGCSPTFPGSTYPLSPRKIAPALCRQWERFAQGLASATAAAKRVLWWDLGTFLLGN